MNSPKKLCWSAHLTSSELEGVFLGSELEGRCC